MNTFAAEGRKSSRLPADHYGTKENPVVDRTRALESMMDRFWANRGVPQRRADRPVTAAEVVE